MSFCTIPGHRPFRRDLRECSAPILTWGIATPLRDAVQVGVPGRGSGVGGPEVLLGPQPRGGRQEHRSAESLMNCILESFRFLSADLAPHELSLFGSPQGPR